MKTRPAPPRNERYFSSIPGEKITRKYPDLETLEQVLSQISKISSSIGLSNLMTRRGQTKEFLRLDPEKYLDSVLMIPDLAVCEGMKGPSDNHNATPEPRNNY